MSVGQSGTNGVPIGSEYWKQQPIENYQPKEIKIFPKKEYPQKTMMDHIDVNPRYDVKATATRLDEPVKDNLDRFPESMKQNFTQDMKDAIEGGITHKEFFDRYGEKLLKKHNHGV